MKKSETPHIIRVSLVFQSELTVENASCTCQKGLGGACGHLIYCTKLYIIKDKDSK